MSEQVSPIYDVFDREIRTYTFLESPYCNMNDIAYNTRRFLGVFAENHCQKLTTEEKLNLLMRAFWYFTEQAHSFNECLHKAQPPQEG